MSPGCVTTSPSCAARRARPPAPRARRPSCGTTATTRDPAGPAAPSGDDDRAARGRGGLPGTRRRTAPAARGHRGAHPAHRPVVAAAAAHRAGAGRLRRLLDGPCVPERVLLLRALHLAVLLALHHHRLRGQHVPGALHRAGLDLAGDLHPRRAPGLPADLLLLPEGLQPEVFLPVFRLAPPGLRGGRAAPALHGRDAVAAAGPEPAPVLLLPGAAV